MVRSGIVLVPNPDNEASDQARGNKTTSAQVKISDPPFKTESLNPVLPSPGV